MNTQKIKLLLTAIEEGSLTKAGNQLGYTQSGVSQIIKSLEEEIGFPLLIKGNTGVKPTTDAEALLPTMRRLVANEESLFQEAAEVKGFMRGSIRIGSFISTSMHWLPPVLSYFQTNYPEIEFHIEECGQEDMVRGLYDGTMDVALMSDPQDRELDFLPVIQDPMVVAFSDKYDFSKQTSVPIKSLKDLPLLLTDADYDKDARKVLAMGGFEPNIRYTSKNDFAVLEMVRYGLGVAILPELVIKGFPDAFDYRIVDPAYYRTLGIGVRSLTDASPLVKLFIRFIQDKIESNLK